MFSGGGNGALVYPRANTMLTFANGSSSTYENFARVSASFENITSGPGLYKELFIPPELPKPAHQLATSSTSPTTTTAAATTTTSTSTTTTPAPGFPTLMLRHSENRNSGYFLDGEGYDDVAVLSLASFSGGNEYRAVNTDFLECAVAENKTKLIIDVSANGGGKILEGYSVFSQLFPHIEPYGANRFRVHEAYNYIGQEISYLSGLVNGVQDLDDTVSGDVSSWFNYRNDLDVNDNSFLSWEQKLGPQLLGPQPDAFTRLIRLNTSDMLLPLEPESTEVSGSGKRKFEPGNIVIRVHAAAGIKTINLGGRPSMDITQAIGGVKQTQLSTGEDILGYVQAPYKYEYIYSAEFYNRTALADYNDLWSYRTSYLSVNLKDGFRQDDPTNVPLQFKYEPADCRMLYTPEMAVDMTAAWQAVADTAFNGVNHCVAGSIGSDGVRGDRKVVAKRQKHGVRSDLDMREHLAAISNVWASRDKSIFTGDCITIP